MKTNKTRNKTEVFQHGYAAGYNQCRVDRGEITQKEADKIVQETLK